MLRTARATLVVILTVAACGGSSLESDLKLNDDPASPLLTVKDEGGFVPIEFMVGQGPRIVLVRDGTLITPGPQIQIYPGPLLGSYQQTQLDEEMMLFVLEELDALDFATIENEVNDEAANTVADASTTVVTFFNQDGSHTFSVYALGIGGQSDARVGILNNLVNRLTEMGFSGGATQYGWDVIQVMAGISQNPPDPQLSTTKPWPLPISFGEMSDTTGFGWRCASYDGVEAQGLLEVFREANQATLWNDGSADYQLAVRPVFPGEEPCAAMQAAG